MEITKKINYDKVLEELISKLEYKPKLLLHSCCGPCSSYVITYLINYFDITIYYYNPNIEPKEEYLKRKNEQIRLIKEMNFANLNYLDCDYDNETYQKFIKGHENDKEGGHRCHLCYELRLEKTCEEAIKGNFEYFGTTLTVSPYKNANILNQIGEKIANINNIKWFYSDFKKKDGYKKSIEFSKYYELYRQDYCGCLFSKNNDN